MTGSMTSVARRKMMHGWLRFPSFERPASRKDTLGSCANAIRPSRVPEVTVNQSDYCLTLARGLLVRLSATTGLIGAVVGGLLESGSNFAYVARTLGM